MKAQSVFENLDFERSGDPIKSMNIGRGRTIRRGDKFIANFKHESQNYFPLGYVEVIAENDESMASRERIVTVRLPENEKYQSYLGSWLAGFDEKKGEWTI